MSKIKKSLIIASITIFVIFVAMIVSKGEYYSYKYSNFDSIFDKAYSDLKNGKITVLEYCDIVGDTSTCNTYKSLHGIK